LEGGSVVGQVTSAAELKLAGGGRVVGLGMMREEAEVGEKTFHYADGTARIVGS
jgi:hypothetical protein